MRIGAPGPMGRILIRGEPGHDIIPELYPARRRAGHRQARQGRVLRDRSRTRSCSNRGIENLIVCGVTTEVCVHTTVREANDRGYRCIVPGDCCGSYFPEFHEMGLQHDQGAGRHLRLGHRTRRDVLAALVGASVTRARTARSA